MAAGLGYQLGCHPGESGILSAAGRHWAVVGGEYSLSRRLVRPSSFPPAGDAGRHHVRLRRPCAGSHDARPGRYDRYSRSGGLHDGRTRVSGRVTTAGTAAISARRIVGPRCYDGIRSSTARHLLTDLPRTTVCLACFRDLISTTARDGRRLAVRVWNSVDPPRARVVFLHGVASHGGWYTRSCHFLSTVGFEVHFLDRRGSGVNMEGRGDVDRYETWIDDVATYLEQIGKSRPVMPVRNQLGRPTGNGGRTATSWIDRRSRPALPRSLLAFRARVLQRLALGGPLPQEVEVAASQDSAGSSAAFHRHAAVARLCGHGSAHAARSDGAFCPSRPQFGARSRARAREYLHTPTLLMLAGRDRIVANSPTRAFLNRSAAMHKTLIEYPNGAHTLEFEADPDRYFADLADWIGRTIASCNYCLSATRSRPLSQSAPPRFR